ncbi:hypothetical protein [Roseibium aggregatum]|uniref:Uncharacterized protein n=1 Tax=Roseibium aggregatum TaxID=187304 RepID=A0A926P3T7_9HYPH|nr:hypothetical protein [Roseibium aggregatum]MBD1549675.1 hypothetical protein [Roseibium aggregatum]
MNTIEMPDRLAQDLIMDIRQNDGKLSKKRQTGIFEKMSVEEVSKSEEIVQDAFADFDAEFGS